MQCPKGEVFLFFSIPSGDASALFWHVQLTPVWILNGIEFWNSSLMSKKLELTKFSATKNLQTSFVALQSPSTISCLGITKLSPDTKNSLISRIHFGFNLFL